MKKILLATCILFASSTDCFAGPLGTYKGMPKSSITNLEKIDGNIYSSKNAPKPSQLFDNYLYVFGKTGLCKVVGVGNEMNSPLSGAQLKSEFEGVVNALKVKYGTPSDEYDFLHSGSIWKESSEWMMSLRLGQRSLATFWSNMVLSDSISSIGVSAKAVDRDTGYITVTYEYDNNTDCAEEADAKKYDSL